MSTLTLVYARSLTLGGLLIRNADRWGRWSHCGIVTEEGTVIEALARHGVVETPSDDFVERYKHGAWAYRLVECPEPARAISWARTQLGKGYDFGAIFGNLLRESWQEDDRWMCSELVEAALVQGGRRRFEDAPWRISPNLSFMVR